MNVYNAFPNLNVFPNKMNVDNTFPNKINAFTNKMNMYIQMHMYNTFPNNLNMFPNKMNVYIKFPINLNVYNVYSTLSNRMNVYNTFPNILNAVPKILLDQDFDSGPIFGLWGPKFSKLLSSVTGESSLFREASLFTRWGCGSENS